MHRPHACRWNHGSSHCCSRTCERYAFAALPHRRRMRKSVDEPPHAATQEYAYRTCGWERRMRHKARQNNKLTTFEQLPSTLKNYF
jgi:hypothetical protein